jgi:hypothetical protein
MGSRNGADGQQRGNRVREGISSLSKSVQQKCLQYQEKAYSEIDVARHCSGVGTCGPTVAEVRPDRRAQTSPVAEVRRFMNCGLAAALGLHEGDGAFHSGTGLHPKIIKQVLETIEDADQSAPSARLRPINAGGSAKLNAETHVPKRRGSGAADADAWRFEKLTDWWSAVNRAPQ